MARVEPLPKADVLHGALDDGQKHVLLGALLLGAEHDEPLVVVAPERSPAMLNAVKGAGGDRERLELEVHGKGGGGEVM